MCAVLLCTVCPQASPTFRLSFPSVHPFCCTEGSARHESNDTTSMHRPVKYRVTMTGNRTDLETSAEPSSTASAMRNACPACCLTARRAHSGTVAPKQKVRGSQSGWGCAPSLHAQRRAEGEGERLQCTRTQHSRAVAATAMLRRLQRQQAVLHSQAASRICNPT